MTRIKRMNTDFCTLWIVQVSASLNLRQWRLINNKHLKMEKTTIIKEIKSIWNSFFYFLTHADSLKEKEGKRKIISYILVFIIIEILSIIFQIFSLSALTFLDIPVTSRESNLNTPLLLTYFVSILIVPVLEEASFRYPLKHAQNNLWVALLAYFAMLFFSTTALSDFSFRITQKQVIVLFLVIFVFLLTRSKTINHYIKYFWDKFPLLIVYLFSAYFAYSHFALPVQGSNLIYLPFVIFPQFAFALYLSYIRLKVGFWYAVLFHFGDNFIFGTASLFSN